MLLHALLDDLELRDHLLEVRGDTGIDVGSIVHDSREVAPGALFCCIPGARSDGHHGFIMVEIQKPDNPGDQQEHGEHGELFLLLHVPIRK